MTDIGKPARLELRKTLNGNVLVTLMFDKDTVYHQELKGVDKVHGIQALYRTGNMDLIVSYIDKDAFCDLDGTDSVTVNWRFVALQLDEEIQNTKIVKLPHYGVYMETHPQDVEPLTYVDVYEVSQRGIGRVQWLNKNTGKKTVFLTNGEEHTVIASNMPLSELYSILEWE